MALEVIINYFQYPLYLLLIVPAFFLVLFLTFKEFMTKDFQIKAGWGLLTLKNRLEEKK